MKPAVSNCFPISSFASRLEKGEIREFSYLTCVKMDMTTFNLAMICVKLRLVIVYFYSWPKVQVTNASR